MRILVTYAVQGEFTELKFPGLIGEEEVQVGYLRTGVGKVKSAFYLSEAISHAQPDLVVNVGTAAINNFKVTLLFFIVSFVICSLKVYFYKTTCLCEIFTVDSLVSFSLSLISTTLIIC